MPGWLRFFCIALLLTPQYTPQAFAQIYTWTDENGSVHFTDEPPVNQPVICLPTSRLRNPCIVFTGRFMTEQCPLI